ncbi:MAG: CDP-glucose 4,6-dehydratase [Verrucomicrobia bacterium]|nr:CDP-glucose 4,6-dehydratase [Verrucomicrobiota bacterium]
MNSFGGVFANRRVLVTGHTGFKGSWLVMWLLELGAEVAGYANGTPGSPCHFDLLGLKNRVRHFEGDVRNRDAFARALDEFRPEIVFHLAAQALVRRSFADPVTTFETNALGTLYVLEGIRDRPWIAAAVLITSDKTYRNQEWCWGYRETDALGGGDPYSGSKSCADIIVSSYFHSFIRHSGTRVAAARAGNVIGGGDWAADRLVPDCVRAWAAGQAAVVRNPQSTRPWQHVLEPLSGYLRLGAELLRNAEGINGEAFNFGPDAEVNQTVEQLLEAMIARWPGVEWSVPGGSEQSADEARLLKLSCDKALFYLDWRPMLRFAETVALTVDWYRAWHEGRGGVFELSRNQIGQYVQLGETREAVWSRH